jgi:hypothetical protein
MFVMKTSAWAIISSKIRRSVGSSRSSAMDLLFRLHVVYEMLVPSLLSDDPAVGAVWIRVGSPLELSTFTTSAPRSASNIPAIGPAIQIVRSTTRTPARGPSGEAPPLVDPDILPPLA